MAELVSSKLIQLGATQIQFQEMRAVTDALATSVRAHRDDRLRGGLRTAWHSVSGLEIGDKSIRTEECKAVVREVQ